MIRLRTNWRKKKYLWLCNKEKRWVHGSGLGGGQGEMEGVHRRTFQ